MGGGGARWGKGSNANEGVLLAAAAAPRLGAADPPPPPPAPLLLTSTSRELSDGPSERAGGCFEAVASDGGDGTATRGAEDVTIG